MLIQILLAATLLQGDPIPAVDGTKLVAGTQCYAILRGGETIGATLQRVSPVDADGTPAWDIVVHQRIGDGAQFDMRDHFVLRRSDLRPIAFESRARRGDDTHNIALAYSEDRVTGARTGGGEASTIDVALPGPVWEGNLWGITFGALPLVEGAHFSLPFYQYDKGLGRFELEVTGSETVETPAGAAEAWTVALEAAPGRSITYLIGKADGAELGTRGPGFGTRLGGDCSGLD